MKCIASLLVLLLVVLTGHAQNEASISVEGEVTKPLKLTVADLGKLPSQEVTAKDKNGGEHMFKGTLLVSVLEAAGVTLGKDLRGKNLAKYVIITAADGYKVAYSLGEIDPELSSNVFLLATQVDGKPLPNGEGPFRMVVPQDKKQARWIREVVSIRVVFSKE